MIMGGLVNIKGCEYEPFQKGSRTRHGGFQRECKWMMPGKGVWDGKAG
jgi:hypothetical protein